MMMHIISAQLVLMSIGRIWHHGLNASDSIATGHTQEQLILPGSFPIACGASGR